MGPALSPGQVGQEAAACAVLGACLGAGRAFFPVRGRGALLPDVLLMGGLLLGTQSYAASLSAGGVPRWYMLAAAIAGIALAEHLLGVPLRAVGRVLRRPLDGTYLAISWHTLPLVYLFYGVLGGVGIGIGYMAPVSTLIRYFPHNRGLATGLAIMGFGFATLFAGPTMQQVTATFGIAENFLIMGTLYVAIMLAASLYLKPPADSMACTHAKTLVETGPTAADAFKTWQFASLWWVFFVNIACGIALFALAAPMAQDVIGMEPGAAAAMVGLIGLFNGGGRFIWSTVSDYIGRGRMYALFFLMEIIAFWQLGNTRDAFLFQAMIFLITSCSGGGFSVMPAYLTDLFGTRLLGAVHGRMLTAWAAAGIVGPMLVSWLRAQTGGYTIPLLFFAGCFVLNFIIALVLQRFGITSAAARFHAAA